MDMLDLPTAKELWDAMPVAAIGAAAGSAITVGWNFLEKKGALTKIFGKASGATTIEDTYNAAFRDFLDQDIKNKIPVSDTVLSELQAKGLKPSVKTNISIENMKEKGVDKLAIMTPRSVSMIAKNEDGKFEKLSYTAESPEKLVRMAWIRQFINDPARMIEESYRPIDARKIDKKVIEDAKKNLIGNVSEPTGSRNILNFIFGIKTANERLNGVANAFNYGARVMLQSEPGTRVTGDGYAAIRTEDTIIVTYKTAPETQHLEVTCSTSKDAKLLRSKKYLEQLAKKNEEMNGSTIAPVIEAEPT